MKKANPVKKLSLSKQSVAVLTHEQMKATHGAMPSILPPSWFACSFTIYCD
jgi:hypothetical protein